MPTDVAAGKQAALLVPGLQSRIPAERRTAIAAHVRDHERFAFLEWEDLGLDRSGPLRQPHYTFEFTPDGLVARFVPEED